MNRIESIANNFEVGSSVLIATSIEEYKRITEDLKEFNSNTTIKGEFEVFEPNRMRTTVFIKGRTLHFLTEKELLSSIKSIDNE